MDKPSSSGPPDPSRRPLAAVPSPIALSPSAPVGDLRVGGDGRPQDRSVKFGGDGVDVADDESSPRRASFQIEGSRRPLERQPCTAKKAVKTVLRILAVLVCLYFFICSLELVAAGFRVVGGRATTQLLRSSVLANPIVGLMTGVLVTVIVQSSSTTTSMVVAMVNAQIISLRVAVPIIMGANIGTTVTNSIVAFGQAQETEEFKLAFAAASIHDFFNWLCVIVQLPLEMAARPLERLTDFMVAWIRPDQNVRVFKPLRIVTEPMIAAVIQVNKTFLDPTLNISKEEMMSMSARKDCSVPKAKCYWPGYLLQSHALSDAAAGGILVLLSMALMCAMLILMVKFLHSLLRGEIEVTIHRVVNANFKYPFHWVAGYLAMLAGAGMTFLVQSSSVFTSSLTPLAGMGLISLERVYPLTLGSNIGTTSTAIIAAVSTDNAAAFKVTLQTALCHLMFNVYGVLLFYVIPFMRIPIPLARTLGNVVGDFPWFSIVYIVTSFVLIPSLVFVLSLISDWLLIGVVGFVLLVIGALLAINKLQEVRPDWLPPKLRSWSWLPVWFRSLEPYDKVVDKILGTCGSLCERCKGADEEKSDDEPGKKDGTKSPDEDDNAVTLATRDSEVLATPAQDTATRNRTRSDDQDGGSKGGGSGGDPPPGDPSGRQRPGLAQRYMTSQAYICDLFYDDPM